MTGCGGSNGADPCLPVAPGVPAHSQGLRFLVRDASGRGQALGDTAITYTRNDSVVTIGYDTLQLDGGAHGTGTFSIRVKRRFYRDTLLANLTVKAGACGRVDVTVIPLTIALAANASPLRAVDILGPTFILGPGR